MRRLPVYFLLDTSGSMQGEPIQALNNALRGMIDSLRSDAHAIDSLWISVITYDREVKELLPLTELANLQLPEITCPQSSPTNMGAALRLLHAKATADVRKATADQKGDWKPLLFIITDGDASDMEDFNLSIPLIKAFNFGAVVGCAAGPKARDERLKQLTDTVVHLDTADSSTLKQFFKWVSDTIEQGNKSQGTGHAVTIPPPPDTIHLVI